MESEQANVPILNCLNDGEEDTTNLILDVLKFTTQGSEVSLFVALFQEIFKIRQELCKANADTYTLATIASDITADVGTARVYNAPSKAVSIGVSIVNISDLPIGLRVFRLDSAGDIDAGMGNISLLSQGFAQGEFVQVFREAVMVPIPESYRGEAQLRVALKTGVKYNVIAIVSPN